MLPSRIKRVEELVKENIAYIVQRNVKDPRVNFVTISGVKVSKDLRNADVNFTIHDETEENIKDSLEGLRAAAGYIRRELGRRVDLRYLPVLKFHYDYSLAHADRINELLDKLHSGEE